MSNIEARIIEIEEQFVQNPTGNLEQYLKQLDTIEGEAGIELTDVLRLEELRQKISQRMVGELNRHTATAQPTEQAAVHYETAKLPAAVSEAMEFLRSLPSSRGLQIEKSVALLKLEAIKTNQAMVEPEYSEVVTNENLPIWLEGYFADNEVYFAENPKMRSIIEQFSKRILTQIESNYQRTLQEYKSLNFDPQLINLNALAASPSELGLITEAATLLGYQTNESEKNSTVELVPRWKTRGNLESAINTRITVGLTTLLNDYESNEIRRPIMRFIVVMADYMAKHMREGN